LVLKRDVAQDAVRLQSTAVCDLSGDATQAPAHILPASPTFHCVTTLSRRMVPP